MNPEQVYKKTKAPTVAKRAEAFKSGWSFGNHRNAQDQFYYILCLLSQPHTTGSTETICHRDGLSSIGAVHTLSCRVESGDAGNEKSRPQDVVRTPDTARCDGWLRRAWHSETTAGNRRVLLCSDFTIGHQYLKS